VTVGAVSFSCPDGRVVTSINAPDAASGTVTADDIARSPADWSAPARIAIESSVVTSGEVVEAIPRDDGGVAVTVRSALALTESLMPPMVCQNLRASEIVYAAARSAGFAPADTRIDGLDDLPTEPIWVLVPIDGLRVARPVRVGIVEFVDAPTGHEMLQRFDPPLEAEVLDALAAAPAFARVAVAARLVYDAEEQGLPIIDTAAAWLTTRLRYAWSHLPDGQLHRYVRSATRVAVERQDGVCVLAVQGARRWWRGTTVARATGTVTLDIDGTWLAPSMPTEVAESDRHALLAVQRAATASDPVQRVSALWEAIEFYVSDRGRHELFSPDEIAAVARDATANVTDEQAARVRDVLGTFLNQRSIIARLQHVLVDDDVPVTADDLALLRRLRRQRNRAVHGAAATPTHTDIDRAVAFISRAVTTRWYQDPVR
jgi:hypothetical protein